MTHIKTTKGLDIPIKGNPVGNIQSLTPNKKNPAQISLNLIPFEGVKFKLFVKAGDAVKIGQALAEDKESPGRYFVSPAGGIVKEIRRGLKRRLIDIVIDVDRQEQYEDYAPLIVSEATREQLVERFKISGIFTRIRQRPFNSLADPNKIPRHIFIKAVESAPFMPSAEMQTAGYEKEFQLGLDALQKLTPGHVHLVYRQGSTLKAFVEAKNVQAHTVEGPHPVANASLHIQKIAPIQNADDSIWTLSALDVIGIGHSLLTNHYFIDRLISLAGPGVKAGQAGYFKVREGFPISDLIQGRALEDAPIRIVSGDILTGSKVEAEDFLGFYDKGVVLIPENLSREFLHFFRAGANKYTFSGAYLSGLLGGRRKEYDFTTNQHGEIRPFIDSSLYDKVMPLRIPTMHLVKALLAEDYDLAVEFGLLEVDSEDFALPSFVCPSKIEMDHIVKQGLKRYAADSLK